MHVIEISESNLPKILEREYFDHNQRWMIEKYCAKPERAGKWFAIVFYESDQDKLFYSTIQPATLVHKKIECDFTEAKTDWTFAVKK